MSMIHDLSRAAKPGAGDGAEQGEEPRSPGGVELLDVVISSLRDSKAEDIATVALDPGAALADAMIIASGRSARHVAAVAERLRDDLRKRGIRGFSIEGLENADWVLVDLGDVIVHVFRPEIRQLYNLEKLWSPHAPRQQ